MTFSILAKDPNSDAIGGAAATGSLCVGAWVLRGIAGVGMSASQGKSASTLWGEELLRRLEKGDPVETALNAVTSADSGREQRQLTGLDAQGNSAAFTGEDNTPEMAQRRFAGGVAAGNMLAGAKVIDAMTAAYLEASAPFAERLLHALRAAENSGSDIRGLQSAALLVLSPDHPPLNLRIDYAEDPIAELNALYRRATTGAYAEWTRQVPTLNNPEQTHD